VTRLLVLNTIIGPYESFQDAMDSLFGQGGYTMVRTAEWPPAEVETYTHLLISGSGLMAGERHDLDEVVEGIIRDFVTRGRCVLGICYGHQMIVRSMLGMQHVTKCAEFGLHKVNTTPNPLFEGIENLVSLESHFEQVSDVIPEFRVIAAGDPCQVQAVQYGAMPVWGLQFHPEYGLELAKDKTRRSMEKYEEAAGKARFEDTNEEHYRQNRLIFRNFLNAQPTDVMC